MSETSQAVNITIPKLKTEKTEFVSDFFPMHGILAQLKLKRPINIKRNPTFTICVKNAKTDDFKPLTAVQRIEIVKKNNIGSFIYKKSGDINVNKEGEGNRSVRMDQSYKEIETQLGIYDDSMNVIFEVIPTEKKCSPIVCPIHKPETKKYVVITAEQRRNYNYRMYIPYDSKKETGFVGIKNQGATCYMNSILQSLYNIPQFRSLIYNCVTTSQTIVEKQKDIILNLQTLFYRLQTSDKEVSTTCLIKSFGWDVQDAMVQHDSTEFWVVLMGALTTKLQGANLAQLNRLFELTTHTLATPLGLPESATFQLGSKEPSYLLPIRIEGVSSVEESLELLLTPAPMDDEITCPDGTKSHVSIRTVIDHLPDVLILQLMRFSISSTGERIKLSKAITYEEQLVVSSSEQGPVQYSLHGVVCHVGSAMGGHYYAYLRPTADGKWFCFNDTHVASAGPGEVYDANFADKAYILFYVRSEAEGAVFAPVPIDTIPAQVKTYGSEASDVAELTVIADAALELNAMQGLAGYRNFDAEKDITVLRSQPLSELYDLIAREFQTSPDSFSLWNCNSDGRPVAMLVRQSNATVDAAVGRTKFLFLDSSSGSHSSGDECNVMIAFLKVFSPEQMSCNFVGSVRIRPDATLQSLSTMLPSPINPVAVFAEKFGTAERVDISAKICDDSLGCGSIIVFQKDDGTPLALAPEDGVLNYLQIRPEENDGLYTTFLSTKTYVRISFVPINDINDPLQVLKCPPQLSHAALFQLTSSIIGARPEGITLFSVHGQGMQFTEIKRDDDEKVNFSEDHTIAFSAERSGFVPQQSFPVVTELCESTYAVSTRLVLHVGQNETLRNSLVAHGITVPEGARVMLFGGNRPVSAMALDDVVPTTRDCIRIIYRPVEEPFIDVSVDPDANQHRPPLFFSIHVTATMNYEELKEVIKQTIHATNAVFNRYRCHMVSNGNQTITDTQLILPIISESNAGNHLLYISTSTYAPVETSVRIYN